MKLRDSSTSGLGITSSKQEKEGGTELDVLDQSPVGVIKINLDGGITYVKREPF